MIRLCNRIATKPWLSGNIFPNIKTCENGLSNFSENLTIVQLKVVEITRFLSPKPINLQLFTFILYGFVVLCDHRRFSVLSPFIEKSMCTHIIYAPILFMHPYYLCTHIVYAPILFMHPYYLCTNIIYGPILFMHPYYLCTLIAKI